MRENVKVRKMQISFILYIYWPSYATFSVLMQDGLQDICWSAIAREQIGYKDGFSEHGSLGSNLIGQNGNLVGMRPLRDSGSQF